MMAKRREARHDPLETVFPTAHWPIGGIDYKIGVEPAWLRQP
jgi:hypothetical protein